VAADEVKIITEKLRRNLESRILLGTNGSCRDLFRVPGQKVWIHRSQDFARTSLNFCEQLALRQELSTFGNAQEHFSQLPLLIFREAWRTSATRSRSVAMLPSSLPKFLDVTNTDFAGGSELLPIPAEVAFVRRVVHGKSRL
jgi:hypothetical protein